MRFQQSLWLAAHHVFNLEGTPLVLRMKATQLVEAEIIRRNFLESQELEQALEMGIPGFFPIITPARGSSTSTVDYFCNERCPYRVAMQCPFFPPLLRKHVPSQLNQSAHARSLCLRPSSPPKPSGRTLVPSRPYSHINCILGSRRGDRLTGKLDVATLVALHTTLNKPHYKYSTCCLLVE